MATMEELEEVECSGGHQSTSLMKAARFNQVELVVTALECTATNLDAVGADGRTALMIAASHGHAKVAKAMVAAGADLDVQDGDGKTALDIAEAGGFKDLAAMLREEAKKRAAQWDAIVGAAAKDDAASMEAMLASLTGGTGGLPTGGVRESPF